MRLAGIHQNDQIVLKKARRMSLEELSGKIAGAAEKNKIDVEKLVEESPGNPRENQDGLLIFLL